MANYRKRGSKWQVQIRRRVGPNLTRTFALKTDAEIWARQMERELDRRALDHDPRDLERILLKKLVERYRDEISETKAGREEERWVLNRFLREPLCQRRLSEIRPADFAKYRDRRMREVTASTVNRQLAPLQHMFEIARTEWNIPLQSNPIAGIRKPKNNPARVRRLAPGEEDRLLEAAKKTQTRYLYPSIILAIETAMRRGEILGIKQVDFSSDFKRLSVPVSKSGQSRIIPLSERAQWASQSLLEAFNGRDAEGSVSSNAFRLNWQRTVRRSGIQNLHFHDLRHEAISRFFERGLSMPEVASISGHKDFRMLARYAHVSVDL